MARTEIPAPIRRHVAWRASYRCEFPNCGRHVMRVDEDGRLQGSGELAHIIPVGDEGPRARYKKVPT